MDPKTLRRIAAVLLFLAGVTSIALPFISATALALSIGVIAAVAGVTQLLRLGQAEDTKGKVFAASLACSMWWRGSGWWRIPSRAKSA